jgi:hypothetical protein
MEDYAYVVRRRTVSTEQKSCGLLRCGKFLPARDAREKKKG